MNKQLLNLFGFTSFKLSFYLLLGLFLISVTKKKKVKWEHCFHARLRDYLYIVYNVDLFKETKEWTLSLPSQPKPVLSCPLPHLLFVMLFLDWLEMLSSKLK